VKHITESYVSVGNVLRDPKEVDENLPGEDVGVSLQIEMSKALAAEYVLSRSALAAARCMCLKVYSPAW